MINVTLTSIDKTISFPSSWNELSAKEIIFIAKQFVENVTPPVAKAAILIFIIESRALEAKEKLQKGWKNNIDKEQFYIDGEQLLQFIFIENTLTEAPENCINLKGIIPYLVYAPKNGFKNISCGEIEAADPYYYLFLDSARKGEPNLEHLASIAAILYRQKSKPFQWYKNNTLQSYPYKNWIPLFRKLSPERLYSIFIWYTGCKMQLPKLFPTMHQSNASETGKIDLLNFTKCIHAGAGPKNGTRDEIRVMPLFEFLFDMEEEALKAQEIERNQQNNG